jgi:hypothetical protein
MLCVRGNRTGRCNRLQAQSLRFYPLNRYHRAVLTEELANEPYPVILGCRGVLVADGGMFHRITGNLPPGDPVLRIRRGVAASSV